MRAIVWSLGVLGALLSSTGALAAPPPVVAGKVPCCNTQAKRWYAPPAVPAASMRPEVCYAVAPGISVPWGTPPAGVCGASPGTPPPPTDPSPPVEITTTTIGGVTTAWVIDCSGKKFDIMKIPESVLTDAFVDALDKLVGEFEKHNGVAIQVRNVKGSKKGKLVRRIDTRSGGPLRGPGGGKSLCDLLRGAL